MPPPHLESRDFTLFRKHLEKIGSTVEVDDNVVYPKQKVHGLYIMKGVIIAGIFLRQEIQWIN
eukprot:14032085-Ditylum_brightwellii.AAC.1